MQNNLQDEGCKAVAAVLPQTQIKELKCSPHPPKHPLFSAP